jgi:hypothetical protein
MAMAEACACNKVSTAVHNMHQAGESMMYREFVGCKETSADGIWNRTSVNALPPQLQNQLRTSGSK